MSALIHNNHASHLPPFVVAAMSLCQIVSKLFGMQKSRRSVVQTCSSYVVQKLPVIESEIIPRHAPNLPRSQSLLPRSSYWRLHIQATNPLPRLNQAPQKGKPFRTRDMQKPAQHYPWMLYYDLLIFRPGELR